MPVNPILSPNTSANALKVASGEHTTVAAADSVVTGLSRVLAVTVSLAEDAADALSWVTCAVPSSGGTITIKTWKNTSGTDPTPAAATAFSKKVSWIAVGY